MIEHQAKCKFCARPCTVSVDPNGARLFGDLESFVNGMCACDRCADLRNWVMRFVDMVNGYKFAQDVPLNERREMIAAVSRKFTQRVCAHYRVREMFDPQLVALFLGKRADKVARGYENEIRRSLNLEPLQLFDPMPTVKPPIKPEPAPEYFEAPEMQ